MEKLLRVSNGRSSILEMQFWRVRFLQLTTVKKRHVYLVFRYFNWNLRDFSVLSFEWWLFFNSFVEMDARYFSNVLDRQQIPFAALSFPFCRITGVLGHPVARTTKIQRRCFFDPLSFPITVTVTRYCSRITRATLDEIPSMTFQRLRSVAIRAVRAASIAKCNYDRARYGSRNVEGKKSPR